LTALEVNGHIGASSEQLGLAAMPWRVIAHGEDVWHVDALAERRPHATAWHLVLAFRNATAVPRQRFLAPFPLEATSKSALFIQAERIADRELVSLLVDRRA
jgi:hypothetical protein